jgi:predicted MFS family arabinose efflux permease
MTTHVADDPRPTYRLLAGLNAGQYVPINFFHLTLVVILRDRGASLGQLALLNLAGVLIAVKFLWAPLLDRYGARRGHFRSWLLVLQPMLAVGLAMLLPLDPVGHFGAVLVIMFLVIQAAAMQDVATDALAVRMLRYADRGAGSGIRLAGGYLGHVIGGGLALLVYSRWGWRAAVLTVVAVTLAPLWQLLSYREQERGPRAPRPSARTLLAVFRQPGVVRWTLVLLPLTWVGVTAGYTLVTPMLVDAGWSPDRIGVVVGIVASAAGIAGATGGGLLIQHFGRSRALALTCAAQTVALGTFIPLSSGFAPLPLTVAVVCGFGLAFAAGSVAINTILMDLTRRNLAASDFTLLTSIGYLLALAGGALGVGIANHTGYRPVLLAAITLLLAAAVLSIRQPDPPVDRARVEDFRALSS